MSLLSIVIPSFKDPLLHKTIESLLLNARGEIEIIPVIDGYELKESLPQDPRVKPIFQENTGMRGAINNAVSQAKGDYLMRTDEHCVFGIGYDLLLTEDMEDNWIVNPRRFRLDTDKWQIMKLPPIDYEKLLIENYHNKFHGIEWTALSKQRKGILIDEDMAMQGSCWAMPHSWWDKTIGELSSEGYHTHYQDSIEMMFKTWQAGGKLMINKKTWYAHKHRAFSRTHSYPHKLARESWDYALETHGEYYREIIYPKFFDKKYKV